MFELVPNLDAFHTLPGLAVTLLGTVHGSAHTVLTRLCQQGEVMFRVGRYGLPLLLSMPRSIPPLQ
jgi:hypothetical protein